MQEELKYHNVGDLISIEGQFFRVIYKNRKTGDNIAAPLTEKEYQELMEWCQGHDRQGAELALDYDDD